MRLSLLACAVAVFGACTTSDSDAAPDVAEEVSVGAPVDSIPAGAADAVARLQASPRHGEWVTVRTGATDSVRAWVVYPERSDPAPVVLVVHEIFGLSHWVRAVADKFAEDGFIAIAPDLLTMRDLPAAADGAPDPDRARAEIGSLDRDVLHQQLIAVAEYGMGLPAAQRSYGIVGYCWGGTVSFEHAIHSPELGASVVYYGTTPDTTMMGSITAPVLGLYGGNDERVNATIPGAESTMSRLGKTYESEIFPGAGHGFLRAQDGMEGANLRATQAAWPRTIAWFREHLEG
jgi:carboxymethylenebutenolidase